MRDGERVRDDPARPQGAFAELYAALPFETELEPWLGWAREARAAVLYLGIGAARLAVPLAREGIGLVGIDAHPGMLRHARRRLPGVELHLSTIEDLELGRTFRLVMAPAGILSSGRRLARAGAHVGPGGRLALELVNPHWVRAGAAPGFRVVASRQGPEGAEVDAEIDYEVPGRPPVTEEATIPLVEPEGIEPWLARAGLTLHLLRGRPGAGLDSSPSYYALAKRASKRLRRAQIPST